jgi:hypothetical protein
LIAEFGSRMCEERNIFARNRAIYPWNDDSDNTSEEEKVSSATAAASADEYRTNVSRKRAHPWNSDGDNTSEKEVISATAAASASASTSTSASSPTASSTPTSAVVPAAIPDYGPQEPLPEGWRTMAVEADIAIDVVLPTRISSAILGHCVNSIHSFRCKFGGPQMCVFKIGAASNLVVRWLCYRKSGFYGMRAIHASMCLAQIEMLEASLIQFFKLDTEVSGGACRNVNKGGEGMRSKTGMPRQSPPYYIYVVGARADQKTRIGM